MKKIGLLLLLLAVGGFAYWRYYVATPKHALVRAYAAAQGHDVEGFNRYVDVNSVMGHLLDEVEQQLPQLAQLGTRLPFGLGASLKPMLAEQAHREVDEYIRSGQVKPTRTPLGNVSVLGIMGGAFSPLMADSAEFLGVTAEQVLPNGLAEVALAFRPARHDTTVTMKLRLVDRGDHWQVAEIADPAGLLAQLARRGQRRFLPGR